MSVENYPPFPKPTTFTFERYQVDIQTEVEAYKNNGYQTERVSLVSFNGYELRKALGYPSNDKENWCDAELYLALSEKGFGVEEKEIFFRRKILLPSERRNDHFQTKCIASVFLSSDIQSLIGEPRFVEVTVTFCKGDTLEFLTKRKWHNRSGEGRKGEVDLHEPNILLMGEFKYLLENPDQLSSWMSEVGCEFDNIENFVEFEKTIRALTTQQVSS